MAFYESTDSRFARHYREESKIVLSAMDCVLNGERAIYCSSELTSGFRFYECLREHGLSTTSELKERKPEVRNSVLQTNIRSACEFANSVRAGLRDKTMVITPAPFSAPEWSQPEYLGFWEFLIRTRIKAVWFNRFWEFSNGCSFEFAVAFDAGVPTLDHLGKPLGRDEAINSLEGAIARLNSEGFDTGKLQENLQRLQEPARENPFIETIGRS
jgi:hypothetical protein